MLPCIHVSDHGTAQAVLQIAANGKFTVVIITALQNSKYKTYTVDGDSFPRDVFYILQSYEPKNVK